MIFTRQSRQCATCKYWMGIRQPEGSGIKADSNSLGKCGKKGHINFNKDVVAYKGCCEWERM